MAQLLIDEHALSVSRKLAVEIGLHEATVIAAVKELPLLDFKHIYNIQMLSNKMPYFNSKTILRIIERLQASEAIRLVEIDDKRKVEFLISKDLNGYGVGNLACGWCGINTLVLHEHHYPIPRSQDGTKTVSICPNCHYEFHTMKYLMEVLV